MNIYDQAHALAAALKDSQDYRDMQRLRAVAYEDDTNRALLDEYKKLQMQLQVSMASGQPPAGDDMQRFQQIAAILQYNSDVSAFMMAEMRFQKTLSDIFKILGDVAGIDLDMLSGT